MELPKTEYNFLLGFYLGLTVFEPMTSTFTYLTELERKGSVVDDLGIEAEVGGSDAEGAG